jgi:divalent metal cation (Fe/Co/Zn/Cd) transporter
VVLLEDAGALVGLAFALLGVGLSASSGDPRFDAMGSLAIGMLLVGIAAILMIEMWGLLIGEAAEPEVEAVVRLALVADPRVIRILSLRTEHLAPDQLLVAAEIELGPDLESREVAQVIDAAEARIREAVPIARIIYLEPDLPGSEAGSPPGI